MQMTVLLASAWLALPAFADPPPPPVRADNANVVQTATSPRLVGVSCSYTTGMMARRVLEDGRDWVDRATLIETVVQPDAKIATPFTAGDAAGVHLIATEFLEGMVGSTPIGPTFELSGRVLEVDGVRYGVLTSYRVVQEVVRP